MTASRSITQGRPKVGALASWLIALVAAALLSGIVFADHIVVGQAHFEVQKPSPLSIRVSPLRPSPFGAHGGAIGIARGEHIDEQQLSHLQSLPKPHAGSWVALYFTTALLLLAWSSFLRVRYWGALLRRQLATLGFMLLVALSLRALFLLTSLSILAAPVAVLGLLVGKRASRASALASATLLALLVAAMVPLDLGIAAALVLQATLPVLLLPRNPTASRVGIALLVAGLASASAYAVAYGAAWHSIPDLHDPLRSTWLAALLGAVLSGALAWLLRPVFEWLCGEVSRRTLTRLERLSQPLLKEISDKAPGTWQHSLAMASLAQAAGEPIAADLPLLRVGAYYHDIGKSLAPKYFIENLRGGDTSVHENLKPAASRDAIFAHVREGIRVARESGLPERVIDFIRTHHGGGTLEYFWTLERASQDRGSAKPEDFCYPGSRPQCRETGILCICDAIEGGTRSLKNPPRAEIENLVHDIVFGKLRAGQLDECGLSIADLQSIDRSLSASLVQAHTHRTPRSRRADAVSTAPDSPRALSVGETNPDLAQLSDVRLDSLDLPKTGWRQEPQVAQSTRPRPGDSMAFSETEALPSVDDTSEDLDSDTQEETEEVSKPGVEDTTVLSADKRRSVQPVQGSQRDEEPLLLQSPRRPGQSAPAKRNSKVESVGQWHDALGAAQSFGAKVSDETPVPPPPPPASGGARETIPLGREGLLLQPGPGLASQPSLRADSNDDLRPGEMVVGAPPATHPERTLPGISPQDEITAEHYAVPDEARRPEDRITEESPPAVPLDAYPEKTLSPGPGPTKRRK